VPVLVVTEWMTSTPRSITRLGASDYMVKRSAAAWFPVCSVP
jgi:hypothetical protein